MNFSKIKVKIEDNIEIFLFCVLVFFIIIYLFYRRQCKKAAAFRHVEIWQAPTEIPGSWYKAFVAAFIPADDKKTKSGYIIGFFDNGMDYVNTSNNKYTKSDIDKIITQLKLQNYQKLNSKEYAKNYGVISYI
jgi:hypothetical protein